MADDGVPPSPPKPNPSPAVPPRPKLGWVVEVVTVDVPKPNGGGADELTGAPKPPKAVEVGAAVPYTETGAYVVVATK